MSAQDGTYSHGTKTYGSQSGTYGSGKRTWSAGKGGSANVDAALSGKDQDAYTFLLHLFTSYGLATLAPRIMEFIRKGYGQDTTAIMLQETPEYKARFSGNDLRIKNGLPALPPDQYLATENAFRDYMQTAGLPPGFYDQPEDFKNWIANGVSPTEAQQRVQAASDLVNQSDPATLAYFRSHYTQGELVAYALDSKRAAPLIQNQIKAAQVGGAAAAQGLDVSEEQAMSLGKLGVSQDQASSGFGFVKQNLDATQHLAQVYGTDYSQNDLVSEVFQNDAGAAKKRSTLASKERANFGGSGGQSKTSLSKGTAGAI